MDPNTALNRIIDRASFILETYHAEGEPVDLTEEAMELAEACEALHGWLSKGGHLPTQWERKP